MTATAATPHRDNLLGICHAVGDAFGVDPLWLRLTFMVALLVNFPLAALAYALSGVAVLAGMVAARVGAAFDRPAGPVLGAH